MRRVFLCDDIPEYRALVRAILDAEADLEVVGEACSGRACIDDVAAARPHLVLLDLHMPGMGGMEALPQLRRAVPEAEVVILSTDDSPATRRRARELGAAGVIGKPRNAFDLPGAVRELVPALDRRGRSAHSIA